MACRRSRPMALRCGHWCCAAYWGTSRTVTALARWRWRWASATAAPTRLVRALSLIPSSGTGKSPCPTWRDCCTPTGPTTAIAATAKTPPIAPACCCTRTFWRAARSTPRSAMPIRSLIWWDASYSMPSTVFSPGSNSLPRCAAPRCRMHWKAPGSAWQTECPSSRA